ncbi:hypothetical protein OQA88_2359 [Cercophora sp. LCS_1]
MPVLGRRPSWQQQLRQTKAKEWLFAGQPDKFPLAELQNIADRLLRDKSPVLSRRGIPGRSHECDVLWANELVTVRGELGIHESAILGCLHLLTYPQARGQILSLRPDHTFPDVFFERRLDAYLQCVVLSRRANPDVCSEDEVAAAEELLGVLKGSSKDFPSILRLLKAIGEGKCHDLLPVALVKKVLKRTHYQENLTRELNSLRRARRWFDAYKLVCGLRDVARLPKADQMLRDLFPDYPMWAAWRPDPVRILSWESPKLIPYRDQLAPILDLEGPDTTGQQRGTLRMSSPGAFVSPGDPTLFMDGDILDRLLRVLDSSLLIGPATIDMLLAVCLEDLPLSTTSLPQLEAAIASSSDSLSAILAAYVRSSSLTMPLTVRLQAVVSVLPLLTERPNLQDCFGFALNLGHRAATLLSEAQHDFRTCVAAGTPSPDNISSLILSLGRELLNAEWLCADWPFSRLAILQSFPTEAEVLLALNAIASGDLDDPSLAGHVEVLARIWRTDAVSLSEDAVELDGDPVTLSSPQTAFEVHL